MKKYLRPGTRVTVIGDPSTTGTVREVRTLGSKFASFEYKIERNKVTTDWVPRSMIKVSFPAGADKKSLLFQLADHLYVNMGDYSTTTQRGDNLLYPLSPHIAECLRFTAHAVAHNAAWVKLYPNHCPHCHGQGGFYYSGNYNEPPGTEPCSVCSEAGLCPRCGQSPVQPGKGKVERFNQWLEQELDCPHCGFTWDGRDGLVDDIGDCGCYDISDPMEYHRQEPEAGMTQAELLDWIRDNLHVESLIRDKEKG